MDKYYTKGQSLMEIVISLTIGAILIAAGTATIIPTLRSNVESKNIQIANSLGQEYNDALQNLAESNWQNIYAPPAVKGASSQFYLKLVGDGYQIFSGATSSINEGVIFTRYFSIENVNRDSSGNIAVSGSDDPSTQKIVVSVTWPPDRVLTRTQYLTRSRNKVFNQSDWSGGPGQEGPIIVENNMFATSNDSDFGGFVGTMVIQGLSTTSAPTSGTNIDSFYRYAWNDVLNWIDFYATGNVIATAEQFYGYATSSAGYIALDCSTSPNGNICGVSNFQVLTGGSGNSNVSGWAWNDAVGWISFDSATAGSSYYYQVIKLPNGRLKGWGWNDIIGWISFNCTETGACGNSDYRVQINSLVGGAPLLANLTSSIFDTQVASGVAINTVMWQGIYPTGTSVSFQIASSNSASGPWNYIGSDGTSATYYIPTGPNSPVQINSQYHNNRRYFRYKIFLSSNPDGTLTPQVDNVIINWSP